MNPPVVLIVDPVTLLTYTAVPSPLSNARLVTMPVASATSKLVALGLIFVVVTGVRYSPPPALVSIIVVT